MKFRRITEEVTAVRVPMTDAPAAMGEFVRIILSQECDMMIFRTFDVKVRWKGGEWITVAPGKWIIFHADGMGMTFLEAEEFSKKYERIL